MGRIPAPSVTSKGVLNSLFCWSVQGQEKNEPCIVTIPNQPEESNYV